MDHNLFSTPSNGHVNACWEWQNPFHTMPQMFCKIASDICLQFQYHCQSELSCLRSCRQGQRNANNAGGLHVGFLWAQTMNTQISSFSIDLLWILRNFDGIFPGIRPISWGTVIESTSSLILWKSSSRRNSFFSFNHILCVGSTTK